ncbi:helix-turn-helix transcriptional regulator [Nocardia sp. NPDC049220]|uniref:helix-turn-helix domain-containing protein n=1 Tax=Nocardia sp. NPDC049220 TaxID=3155273 RepID=UPI0033C0AE26
MTAGTEPGFARQPRYWRTLRRVSQLDLAIRADTAQRHLSFLEQGRSRPGRTMVVRLAPALDELIAELEGYLPQTDPDPDHLGFAVPLRPRGDDGELRSITTLTSLATAVDITRAELHLEAFLPANEQTARILRDRAAQR